MSQSKLTFPGFVWLDVVDPTPEEMSGLEANLKLPREAVEDCLEPEHLPKFEDFGEFRFLLLRAYDQSCAPDADCVRDLTRKLAVFISPKMVITVHRQAMPFFTALLTKYGIKAEGSSSLSPDLLLLDFISSVVHTYDKPVMDCMDQLENLEQVLFGAKNRGKFHLKSGYYLKRRASVFKRMLRTTAEPLNSLAATGRDVAKSSVFRNVREHMDSIYFYADEITDTMDSMLNLQLSMASQRTNEASHRTNEVIRVLTIFSMFFLPINFIAAVYGMNFESLPGIKSDYGHYIIVAVMVFIEMLVFVWIRRKGWLK